MKISEIEQVQETLRKAVILAIRDVHRDGPRKNPLVESLKDANALLDAEKAKMSARGRTAGRVKSEAKTVNCRKAAQINADRIRKNG